MISSDEGLRQAVEQMQRLYRVLASLRREVERDNPGLFVVMAEGPLELLHQIEEQVDAYVGLAELREGDDLEALIRRADEALLDTRRSGLGRI